LDSVFTPVDLVIFFGLIVFAMVVGLIAGRKEETAEDFFLAGHKVRWWGVAGSIFGSNVSANHMVGMMGIGFSIGFAQSHFELGAIAGLMLLCYGFLPVYRKLNLYTLSEYLEKRYDERSRICYAIIMVIIMAVVHLVPAMYIGSRSICVLMGGNAVQ
jgi:SSS family solute:Na+ symporter